MSNSTTIAAAAEPTAVLPPLPHTPGGFLPQQTAAFVVGTDTAMPLRMKWADGTALYIEPKENGKLWRDGALLPRGAVQHLYGSKTADGKPIPDYDVRLLRSFRLLQRRSISPGGDPIKFTTEYTHGVRTETKTTLSLEIGVQGEGMGTKLSASWEHTVQVYDETKVTYEYTFRASPHHYVDTSYWQEFLTVEVRDKIGRPLTWGSEEKWAVVKTDWNSGSENQSYYLPPTGPWVFPQPLVIESVAYFNGEQAPVPPPAG